MNARGYATHWWVEEEDGFTTRSMRGVCGPTETFYRIALIGDDLTTWMYGVEYRQMTAAGWAWLGKYILTEAISRAERHAREQMEADAQVDATTFLSDEELFNEVRRRFLKEEPA